VITDHTPYKKAVSVGAPYRKRMERVASNSHKCEDKAMFTKW